MHNFARFLIRVRNKFFKILKMRKNNFNFENIQKLLFLLNQIYCQSKFVFLKKKILKLTASIAFLTFWFIKNAYKNGFLDFVLFDISYDQIHFTAIFNCNQKSFIKALSNIVMYNTILN